MRYFQSWSDLFGWRVPPVIEEITTIEIDENKHK